MGVGGVGGWGGWVTGVIIVRRVLRYKLNQIFGFTDKETEAGSTEALVCGHTETPKFLLHFPVLFPLYLSGHISSAV